MERLFYLLKLEVFGIKNIEKTVEIDFYKKTIADDFNPEKYKIKGIYGENGSGKTAIVTAVKIFRNLIINPYYLADSDTQEKLFEIINKKTQGATIAAEFYDFAKHKKIYRYEISLQKAEDDRIIISGEKLFVKGGIYSKNSFNTVFIIESGVLKELSEEDEIADEIKVKTMNLLERQSFASCRFQVQEMESGKMTKSSECLNSLIVFALFLQVYMDEADHHSDYYFRERIKEYLDSQEDKKESDAVLHKSVLTWVKSNETRIHKNVFEHYRKRIARLTEFLKIFKPQLKDIEIERKEDKNYYNCRLILKYEDYQLDMEFESRGIRKVAELFDYMDSASSGLIVFIDEMDANINDIYLDKLIEFMMYYGKGQLCFTAHNLSPMKLLKENRMSISFISSINTVHTWTSKGNMNPENAYRNGFVEDSPFNVQASDFLGVLGGDN